MEHEIRNGPACTFGRRWFITYLRQQLGFKARRNDVAALLLAVDNEAVIARRPGLRKIRLETTPHQVRTSFGVSTGMTSSHSIVSRSTLLSTISHAIPSNEGPK